MEASQLAQEDRLSLRKYLHRSPGQISQLFANLPQAIRNGASPRSSVTSIPNTDLSSVITNNPALSTPITVSLAPSSSPHDPFRDSLIFPKIRGAPISLYPHASYLISDDHYERFRAIVVRFKENVEVDAKLKPYISDIDYSLRMCGRSPKEAQPSIVAFCPEKIAGSLKDVLSSTHLKEQYAIPQSRGLMRWVNRPHEAMSGDNIPRFGLYIWRGKQPRTLLWRGGLAGDVLIRRPSSSDSSSLDLAELTMCGSKITGADGSSATLACLLQIDSSLFGLTVAHAFPHRSHRSSIDQPQTECPGDCSILGDDGADRGKYRFPGDDVEYESFEESDADETGRTVPSAMRTGNERFNGEDQPSGVLIMDPDNSVTPDLDWALIEVSASQGKKPNLYLRDENSQELVLLTDIAQRHPGQEREVLIIKSPEETRPGTLLRGSSIIGGINRPGQCEVWNVAFEGAHGLVQGDSGSLVVDRITNEIYGYVVGLNPIGEAYIIPLMSALDQMKHALNTEDVSLPDPIPLAKELTDTSDPGLDSSLSLRLLRQALNDYPEGTPIAMPPTNDLVLEDQTPSMHWSSRHSIATSTGIPETVNSQSVTTGKTSWSSNCFGLEQPPRHPTGPCPELYTEFQNGIFAFTESAPNEWRPCYWDFETVMQEPNANVVVFLQDTSQIDEYRHHFREDFWPAICQDINGSSHCEYAIRNSCVSPQVSWSCFKIKEVRSANDYQWTQPAIYIEWNCETGRQLVFLFSFLRQSSSLQIEQAQSFVNSVSDYEDRILNPFVWHRKFADEILARYDTAYWILRDLVRLQEKASQQNPYPRTAEGAYAQMHLIAHYLAHSVEAIEVAEHTLQVLITEQQRWRQESPKTFRKHEALGSWMRTLQGLSFKERTAHSLKIKIKSLRDRYHNDIDLAFNIDSQKVGQAASGHATNMKIFSFVSLLYIPGVFVTGIFSMDFFSTDFNGSLTPSSNFWVFWATAMPLTILTMAAWWLWQHPGKLGTIYKEITSTTPDHQRDPVSAEKRAISPSPLTNLDAFERQDSQDSSYKSRGLRSLFHLRHRKERCREIV
ncbi:hypothetical protein BJY04DRAFT_213653 [Aspergillus karnatakaensis]|uniref:uncharacterized protein n=1 Tax=Aspergillus karnatakaensis TaxID=1810916 RepID=UPI003CCE311A